MLNLNCLCLLGNNQVENAELRARVRELEDINKQLCAQKQLWVPNGQCGSDVSDGMNEAW